MGMGPIASLPPLTTMKPSRSAEELNGVYAIQFSHEEKESYTPKNQKGARGLEDEEDDTVTLGEISEDQVHFFERAGEGAVNFFA